MIFENKLFVPVILYGFIEVTFGPFAWENVPAFDSPPVTQKLVYYVRLASDIGDLV